VSLSPVDPITAYRQANPGVSAENIARMEEFWGVNEPAAERYLKWGASILQGDLGESKIFRRPVIEVIGTRFPATLALMLTAWAFSGILGFGTGCLMGMKNGRLLDRIIKRVCLIMCSIPTFWIGLVFIMIFSVQLGLFPLGMSVPIGVPADEVTIWQRLHHLILPAFTLSLLSFANVALHTREKLVEVLQSEYVLFARARGESDLSILRRHGLRNILMPAVTMQFASFAELFGGSIIAENVFSFPGLGSAASAAGLQGDIPLLLGITLFSVLFVFIGNAIANALYIVIDPRTKEGNS
jgi:peptide/nickel transport system permease protein